MFEEYKELIKGLRKQQDELWKDAMAGFPGLALPRDMSEWQKKTLDNVNSLVERAVGHSLELQRDWLQQWADRAGEKKLKPKAFAELSTEARESTQRWLDNQNKLWEQWLEVLRSSGSKKAPDFGQWEKAVQESFKRQMDLLDEWSEMGNPKKLSFKELGKLTDQIEKSMQKSIETQQQMWLHWFDNVSAPAAKAAPRAKPAAKKKTTKTAAKPSTPAKKAAPKKAAKGHDDLKQISGIGPGLEKKLKDSGIHSLHEIAALSESDITHLEEEIIKFSGRINRDKWVQQAKKLIS
jgi:predicted flap endonuclease-1-like 5' DNA nuclease